MAPLRIGLCFNAEMLTSPAFRKEFSAPDVLLFPELMDGGYAALNAGKPPHIFYDNFLASLRKSSRDFSFTLIAGSVFLRGSSQHRTNTSLAFSRGKLIHRYDKIHLFKPTGDRKFFQRGKLVAKTFQFRSQTTRIRAGVVICYDLRFPELTRALAMKGIEILFVPARWPHVRDEAWQSLLKARAIENQIFVVGCNSTDAEGGFSYAFNPMGRMIFSNRKSKKKALQTFEVNFDELQNAKKLHHNLADAVFLKRFS